MATPNPNIIYRSGSAGPLTFDQLDGNFALLSQSIAGISTINTSSLATTGSNTFTAGQTIVGNVTFPSSSFISTSNVSGSLFLSALNEGTLFLNNDGGEGDVVVGYNGWTHKMDVRGPIQVTNIQGTGSLYLKPDESDIAERQFEIYNTAPSDIHFKGSATHSFFGDDTNYLKIDDNAATVTIDSTNGLFINSNTTISGDTVFSGSILVSGSIIPNVSGSSTSSFSLGSPTNAWKDIYVSNGTINFLDGAGNVQSTIGTGNNQLTGDTFITGKLSQGLNTTASGNYSHAEGNSTKAIGTGSHAEGLGTIAAADYQHVAGRYNITSSNPDDLFIIGNGSGDGLNRQNILKVDIYGLKIEYGNAIVTGSLFVNEPSQLNQVVFGPNHNLSGYPGATGILLQGRNNQIGSNGYYSHAEGWYNAIDGYACHAEGRGVTIGLYSTGSHAEGFETKIARSTHYAHVEGFQTVASGAYSHAEGGNSISRGIYSHAEGIGTITIGTGSHAEGLETIAKGNFQHVAGQYNATSSVDSAFIVGNGIDGDNRSNLIFAAEETVSINNILQLTRRTTNPISPVEGSIMASGSAGSSKLYYYNGTTWVDLTA
jgi:hypothetical protein